jgi:heptosyltransferase-2/heptosyltransferase-3
MRNSALDREALVLRNRTMAEAFHRTALKHRVRRTLLLAASRLPVVRRRRTETGRILLIRPDHLGDVLLTTPAITALRRALPTARLHALVGPWSADVLSNYRELDAVLTLPFPAFSRSPKPNWRSPYEIALHTANQVRRIGYDAALILRPDHWWGALVAQLAGIPRRIGYALPDTAPFLTDALPLEHQHVVLQSARLVETLTDTHITTDMLTLDFPVLEADRYWAQGYLEEWGIAPTQPIVTIHPGSGTWVKRWDEAPWASVADELREQLNAAILFTGSDHELPMISQIVEKMRHTPAFVVGDANIGQLAAIYTRSLAVLGPDSGPLHLAAAVGTPTVTLFGPADPVEFGTWGSPDRHIILTSNIGCRPCRVIDWGTDDPANHPCVRDITVERVLEAARRLAQRDRF